jgi:hypothetical protein
VSLHLHQVPQADMLECKLEILLLVPYRQQKPARLNMQPQRGQYNNILANDTYLVAFVERLKLHDIWLVDLKGNLQKANFIQLPLQNLFIKILFMKG